jgi:sodium-dependent dicarboxylate transporter 2/3/5
MNKSIGLLIGLAAFIAILVIPIDPAVLPQAARYAAAVTVLMAVLWITQPIPLAATALIPVVAFPLLGVLSASEACAPYADKVIFLFLGGFIIAMSMQRWGLHKRIALRIISIVGLSPRRMILGFMIATAFLSMWMSNTATAMMMIPIAIAIIATVIPAKKFSEMDAEQKAFATCIVLAVAYAASIGGIATLIGTPANGILTAQLQILFPQAPQIDFFTWLKFGIPLLLIMLPAVWLWMTQVVFRKMPKTLEHARDALEQEVADLGPMSRGEKNTLAVFLFTAFCWIFAQNKDFGAFTVPGLEMIFPGIDDTTIAILGALLLFIIPVNWEKHEFTMNWEWAVKIPWGILLLFGGGMCLSAAFIRSGLAEAIVGYVTVFEALPVIVLVLILALAVSFLTEVTSNTAIASVMMPILAVAALSLQVNPLILMMTAAVCSSFAFMLPVATPPNAIAYGTEYVQMRDMVSCGFILNLAGILVFVLLLFTLILWAFGITVGLPPWAAAVQT